jgi:hypothetical protein
MCEAYIQVRQREAVVLCESPIAFCKQIGGLARTMTRSDHTGTDGSESAQADTGVDRHAKQPPDTKQRAIEHGAEEYYRREGSVAESERAGQPLEGGDAEASSPDRQANRGQSR